MFTAKIFSLFSHFFFLLDPMNLRAKDGKSCDSQCIGGCFKGGSRNECYACRQVLYEFSEVRNNQSKNCIQECPDGFLLVSIKQFFCFSDLFFLLLSLICRLLLHMSIQRVQCTAFLSRQLIVD